MIVDIVFGFFIASVMCYLAFQVERLRERVATLESDVFDLEHDMCMAADEFLGIAEADKENKKTFDKQKEVMVEWQERLEKLEDNKTRKYACPSCHGIGRADYNGVMCIHCQGLGYLKNP